MSRRKRLLELAEALGQELGQTWAQDLFPSEVRNLLISLRLPVPEGNINTNGWLQQACLALRNRLLENLGIPNRSRVLVRGELTGTIFSGGTCDSNMVFVNLDNGTGTWAYNLSSVEPYVEPPEEGATETTETPEDQPSQGKALRDIEIGQYFTLPGGQTVYMVSNENRHRSPTQAVVVYVLNPWGVDFNEPVFFPPGMEVYPYSLPSQKPATYIFHS